MEYQKNPDEIGVLWEKVSRNGAKFFSGILDDGKEKLNIVVFANKKQAGSKAPDYVILKSKPREEVHEDGIKEGMVGGEVGEITEDLIPF